MDSGDECNRAQMIAFLCPPSLLSIIPFFVRYPKQYLRSADSAKRHLFVIVAWLNPGFLICNLSVRGAMGILCFPFLNQNLIHCFVEFTVHERKALSTIENCTLSPLQPFSGIW